MRKTWSRISESTGTHALITKTKQDWVRGRDWGKAGWWQGEAKIEARQAKAANLYHCHYHVAFISRVMWVRWHPKHGKSREKGEKNQPLFPSQVKLWWKSCHWFCERWDRGRNLKRVPRLRHKHWGQCRKTEPDSCQDRSEVR